mmetsp:Transcript_3896/g.4316  ORF Transcript_3896/g.4316 Transcript_3896/m.4316 type:complete len:662 (+) Transcript_3896:26-2011(+)
MEYFKSSYDRRTLVALTRKRILRDVIAAARPKSGFAVLVVDALTTQIISACCTYDEVVGAGIILIEPLERKRQPLPMEAIYFISPTRKSVQTMINDFRKTMMYTKCHIFFSSHLDDNLFHTISQERIVGRIKHFTELNLEYLAYEARAFHLNMPTSLHVLYSKSSTPAEQSATKDLIARRLVTVCASMGQVPSIRHSKTTLAATIASKVSQGVEELKAKTNLAPSSNTSMLIIDRTQDLIAPLLHEFTFQAMAMDVLNVEKNVFEYKYTNEKHENATKACVLNDRDDLWKNLRHEHIAKVLEVLKSDIKPALIDNHALGGRRKSKKEPGRKESIASRRGKSPVKATEDLQKLVRMSPEYSNQLGKFQQHLTMATQCMDVYNSVKLDTVALLEQALATGQTTVESKLVKFNFQTDDSFQQILEDPEIKNSAKLRLLLILNVAENNPEVLRRMMAITKIKGRNAQQVIDSLNELKKLSPRKDHKRKAGNSEWKYKISRFKPAVYDILEKMADEILSFKDYPNLHNIEQTQTRSKKSKKIVSKDTKSKRTKGLGKWGGERQSLSKIKDDAPQLILFIIGGMTHSEIREAYKLSQKLQISIFIGSTHICTPSSFVFDLRNLHVKLSDINAFVVDESASALSPMSPSPSFSDGRPLMSDYDAVLSD